MHSWEMVANRRSVWDGSSDRIIDAWSPISNSTTSSAITSHRHTGKDSSARYRWASVPFTKRGKDYLWSLRVSRVVVWGQRGGCPACVVGFVSFAWRDEIAMIGPGPGLLSLSLYSQLLTGIGGRSLSSAQRG